MANDANALPVDRPRPARSTNGLLAIWHGVEPGFEPAFDEWYDRQHHAERVAIAGFSRARRYLNLDSGPRYFSRYDVDDPSVLASTPYLHALNHPTPWTRSLMPRYRGTTRSVFAYRGGAGDAEGSELVTLRLPRDAAGALGAAQWSALAEAPGVLRVESWEADVAVSGLRTEEKALRGTADAAVDRAILVEGSHRGRLDDALARHLLPLLEHPAVIDRYRLVYQLRKD